MLGVFNEQKVAQCNCIRVHKETVVEKWGGAFRYRTYRTWTLEEDGELNKQNCKALKHLVSFSMNGSD